MIVHAAAADVAKVFVAKLSAAILFPLITLMTVIALIFFLYGCFEFVVGASSSEGREKGKKHILWGVIGLLVMLSAYAILSIAANTFNIDVPEPVDPFAAAPLSTPAPLPRPSAVAPAAAPAPAPRPVVTATPVPFTSVTSGVVVCSSKSSCPNSDGDIKGIGVVGDVHVVGVGESVKSLGAGTVTAVLDGSRIQVQHDDGTIAQYDNVTSSAGVTEGGRVSAGQSIGTADSIASYASIPLRGDQTVVTVTLDDQNFRPLDQERYIKNNEIIIIDGSVDDPEP